ncbi:hypothetical protein P175DRAFT_0490729 [Aspergillus ochraceoroseus IBT 24754]|uniref:Uncharacterized protein n=2 Tax=Aspergillus ochraceoroseus TaxID=138278 RepID=A0A2T5M146_9EURO|nr:uncharacterized protein P175DRAFT_0490729 [Aspergillus ochraceoroseus IBT 24754]KKK23239.1 hypothetical protein AOCH_004404 [Aspergillus ochraceoroseus]PTU22250.1 hypothetical protein P175DRAFT_0490729 [Aspergillus ochraceoroseus IBT 24754]
MILSSSLLALSARLPQALFTPWDSLAFPEENMRNKRSTEDVNPTSTTLSVGSCTSKAGQHCPSMHLSNTNISAASVRGKWSRFCSQACQDPDTLLKNLTAPDVKSWFDWIKENFSGSIKAHSALANY